MGYKNKLYVLKVKLTDKREATWYFDLDAQVELVRQILRKDLDAEPNLISSYHGVWSEGKPPSDDFISDAKEFRAWVNNEG